MIRKRLRILLADDDEVTRAVLGSMLRIFKYEVDEVTDGCEVIKVVSENSYDVILMDLKMRPMDGVTASLFVRLKEQELRRRTPIIALTACSPKECREECFAAGINAYVAKPVDLKELLLLMEALLLEQGLATPEAKEPERLDLEAGSSSGLSLCCLRPGQLRTEEAKLKLVPSAATPRPGSGPGCPKVLSQE